MSTIKVLGIPELTEALKGKQKEIQRAVARGVTKGALMVQKTAREKILKGPKSGKTYTRGKANHRASAPGEAPANDLGNLQRSIQITGARPGVYPVAYVNANTPYAAALENGTKDGKLEPRPFMTPSVTENADAIVAVIRKEIQEVVG